MNNKNTKHQQDHHNNEGDGSLQSQTHLQSLLQETFPSVELAFAYGSGVFSQQQKQSSSNSDDDGPKITEPRPMLDLILVVDNAHDFHSINQERNASHYPFWLRYSSRSLAPSLQRHFPLTDAKVLFHVVDSDDPQRQRLKYGVVQKVDLLEDLTTWRALYLAGRLHKPTLAIRPQQSRQQQDGLPEDVQQAQTANLQAALAASLLLVLSNNNSSDDDNDSQTMIPWVTLFAQIASLSYSGDFRMQMGGEDPHKIEKLIHAPGQLDRFHHLYLPAMDALLHQPGFALPVHGTISPPCLQLDPTALKRSALSSSSSQRQQYQESPLVHHLWQALPSSIRQQRPTMPPPSLTTMSQLDQHQQNEAMWLSQTLSSIVAPIARNQSLKGVLSLGWRKSIRYGVAKLIKGGVLRR